MFGQANWIDKMALAYMNRRTQLEEMAFNEKRLAAENEWRAQQAAYQQSVLAQNDRHFDERQKADWYQREAERKAEAERFAATQKFNQSKLNFDATMSSVNFARNLVNDARDALQQKRLFDITQKRLKMDEDENKAMGTWRDAQTKTANATLDMQMSTWRNQQVYQALGDIPDEFASPEEASAYAAGKTAQLSYLGPEAIDVLHAQVAGRSRRGLPKLNNPFAIEPLSAANRNGISETLYQTFADNISANLDEAARLEREGQIEAAKTYRARAAQLTSQANKQISIGNARFNATPGADFVSDFGAMAPGGKVPEFISRMHSIRNKQQYPTMTNKEKGLDKEPFGFQAEKQNGKTVVFPTLLPDSKGQGYAAYDPQYARDVAIQTGNYLVFDSDEEANKYIKGGWKQKIDWMQPQPIFKETPRTNKPTPAAWGARNIW